MNSIWRRLDALAGGAVTRAFGENVRLSPMLAASDYVAAAPDPGRAVRTVRGVFTLEPGTDDLRGQRLAGESRGTARVSIAEAAVQITAAQASTIGYRPRAGDIVALTDRPGPPTYSVAHVEILDCDDLTLFLAREPTP